MSSGLDRRWPAAWPLVGCVILAAAGYYPTAVLAGQRGLRAMAVAQVVVLAVVYATLVPAMRRLAMATPERRLQVALSAAVVRFVATVFIAAAVAWRGIVDPAVFLIWVGIAYVVMIKIETLSLIAWMRVLEKRPC